MKPGKHVTPDIDYSKFDWDRPQGHRRSVYRLIFRTLPDPFVACLDGADASQLTAVRTTSVTAPQALALMNNEFILVHSQALAQVLEKQSSRSRFANCPGLRADLEPAADAGRTEGVGRLCRSAWPRQPLSITVQLE